MVERGEAPGDRLAPAVHQPQAGRGLDLADAGDRRGAGLGCGLYRRTLGDARLALEVFRGTLAVPGEVFTAARARMEQPTPRVGLGQALRGVASSAIDISDGLVGDLGHILRASGVGCSIPTSIASNLIASTTHPSSAGCHFDAEKLLEWVLNGGDDYELAFTAPAAQRGAVQAAAQASATPVTRIGQIEAAPGLRLVDGQGQPVARRFASFDHFA